MNNQNDVKIKFFTAVKDLLKKNKKEWDAFRFHWDKEEYREAYLIMHEVLQQLKIELGEEYSKIDEEFYGLFIN